MLDNIPSLLHGGDYNPDQWLDRPDVLAEDIRLMKLAGVNAVTLGVFSWASLNPNEGEYTFGWLDDVMDRLHENGIFVVLSTVSGGKPPWLVKKYPQIMRVNAERRRLLYGDRENHCNSHPIYRREVRRMDEELAKRYGHHPALILWHISNEMYGTCHCPLCQEGFGKWLKNKYKTIDELNRQYASAFWSHKYSDFAQIESPSPVGEAAVHGLALDFARFYSDLSIDFLKMEIDAVQKYNPAIPVTTNMFHLDCGIDYGALQKIIDIASWDSYPKWHCGKDKSSEWQAAAKAAFTFDYCRSLKPGKPFLLMESTPSTVNNNEACKLKRPGMHMLSAMQAVAFGSDSVMYFQWRKSRGAYEKFHGAVVGHGGGEHTRVFRDVCEVGQRLKALAGLRNIPVHSDVAILYDWDNIRALREQKSLKRNKKDFDEVIFEHYEALLKNYLTVDVIRRDSDFSKYKLIVAPVLYLFGNDTAGKIERFVKGGGHFVTTFYSGMTNENDLVFEGLPPHGLHEVLGIEAEETDAIMDDESNEIRYGGNSYRAVDYCDVIHTLSAKTLATYEHDFYAGFPAVTKNGYGAGTAYYVAFRSRDDFLRAFYLDVSNAAGVLRNADAYTDDVMAARRGSYLFLMNFAAGERTVSCGGENHTLSGYECRILSLKT